jgi:hypothetical protein
LLFIRQWKAQLTEKGGKNYLTKKEQKTRCSSTEKQADRIFFKNEEKGNN